VRRFVTAGIAVMLMVVLSWWLLEDPISHVWYNTRQGQRAASFHQARKLTAAGQTLAILQIPNVGANLAVVQGDSVDILRGGPGHVMGTPLPGAVGNSLIVGHRKGWGAPFARLSQLQPGDSIDVQLHGQGLVLLFTVAAVNTVRSTDLHLFAHSNDHRLTLVTSASDRFSNGRYLVVSAVSGTTGTLGPARTARSPAPSRGSPVFNRDIGATLLRAGLAVGAILLLRRRYKASVVTALAIPLVLATLLSLTLGLDRLLPALG
jgi:sortase A